MHLKKIFNRNKILPNRVNVGCGPNARAGWVNVDIQKFSSVDRVMDVTKKWNFKNLEYIYAEHFLEHLEIKQGLDFIYNAGQSLKKDGWLRMSTPNIEWVLKTHYKWDQLSNDNVAFNSVMATNRAFYGWGHKFLYSEWILKKLLEDMGYTNIQFYGYGESDIEVFDGIEQHGGYFISGDSPSVLIVEAQKGNAVVHPKDLLSKIEEEFIRHSKAKG